MGKPCFSKLTKFFAIALLGTATAIAAIAVLSTPATAHNHGGGVKNDLFAWDTDNLAGGGLSAKNYRIPFHDYSKYTNALTVKPKACVRHIWSASESRYVSSLGYEDATGRCPIGYSLLTQVCSYGSYRYKPISYDYVNRFKQRAASYGVPNRDGTCARITYATGLYCDPNIYSGRGCVATATESIAGSLVSVQGGVEVCRDRFGNVSLRRSAEDCYSPYAVSGKSHPGCKSAVADAFFQTGGSTGAVNDFPIMGYGSEEAAATVTAAGSRNSGCADFAEQQDRLVTSMGSNGGWYLDSEGNLRKNAGEVPSRVLSRPAAVYGTWAAKGTNYYHLGRYRSALTEASGESYRVLAADDSSYDLRTDQRNDLAMASGLPTSGIHPWNTDTRPAGSGFAVRCSWPATSTTAAIAGCYDVTSFAADAGTLRAYTSYAVAARSGLKSYVNKSYGLYGSVLVNAATMNSRLVHLSTSQDSGDSLCMEGWHPRGQDGVYTVGPGTGRTLSSINTEAEVKAADAHWCRSDVRYRLKFKAQQHRNCQGETSGSLCRAPTGVSLPAVGDNFSSYGRKNCYKTMIGYDETNAECRYVFPLPKCDPNPNNNIRTDWREFTAAEIANIGVDGEPLLVEEGADCGTNIKPPDLAGFDADACVAVDIEVFESRPSGSNAEPGVDSSDRTVTASATVAVYDLDISAPFPETASPPLDDGSDPSGCADGEEERADHGTRASPSDSTLPPASNQRKSTSAVADPASSNIAPYPLPKSSSSSNTAAPPSDYDADNSYAGVRGNIAHRYASEIAENTCAAKREEAELVLAVLEAREDSFEKWLTDYKTAADRNAIKFNGYTAVSANYTGLSAYWAADVATERTRAAAALKTAYENLSDALVNAKRAYNAATDRTSDLPGTTADDRARVIAPASSAGCFAHYDAETARLKKLFTDAETAALGGGADGIAEEVSDVKNNAPTLWNRPKVNTDPDGVSQTPSSVGHVTSDSEEDYDCETDEDGERTCKTRTVTSCSGYSYTVRGRTTGSYTPKTRSLNDKGILVTRDGTTRNDNRNFTGTFTVHSGSYKSTDTVQGCPSVAALVSGKSQSQNEADIRGDEGTVTGWPKIDKPVKPTAIYTDADTPAFMLDPSLLLGKYHPEHEDRDDLDHPNQLTRANAAIDLGTLTAENSEPVRTPAAYAAVAVPETQNLSAADAAALRSALETAAEDYRDSYIAAYDRAYQRARSDMGGTGSQQQAVWRNFHWEYDSDSLIWGGYTQNTTANTTLSDGTVIQGQPGCDLMRVASDGTTTIAATRLDYETGSYGLGNTFTVRTAEQRECKIRRTRTPRLTLRYEPPTTAATSPWRACPATMTAATLPCGTDTHSSKTGDYYNTAFTPDVAGAQKFKLYPRKDTTEPSEAEIFNLRISIADSPPVLCYQPGEALVAHVAAKGIDAVNKAVFRNASGFAGGNKKHCYRHPSAAQLGSPRRPAFVFFDDTAHSAMASVNVVWQQPNPKIVSKLGSTDDLKMMANTVALEANSPVAYDDATRTSSFYGTYYTFPTDTSVKSPSGWNITGHPTLTLTSTFTQHEVQAKDTIAKTPTTHTMVFKFVDCVFGIEDVAFVDNIASPYALLSDENGVVPARWKQTYDSDPHNSPTWYYPAFSTYEGALRLDGRRDSNGDPITYGRNTQGGFAHPSYALGNSAADGTGWGIVYEDKVGKQQPVWAIHAPPVPGDNTHAKTQVSST